MKLRTRTSIRAALLSSLFLMLLAAMACRGAGTPPAETAPGPGLLCRDRIHRRPPPQLLSFFLKLKLN